MTAPTNLLAPDIRRDPYPTYAALREGPPVRVEPGGVWAITRYEDVQAALKQSERFSSAAFEALYKPPWLPHNPLGDSLITRDGAAHAKLRTLVSRAFTPRGIARLEPRIRELAIECAEQLRGHEKLDFIAEFACKFPAQVIAELLGLDPALHLEFRRWVDDISSISPVPPPDEVADRIRTTVGLLETYLREVVDAHRRVPKDDLVGDLMNAELDGVALTDEDLVAFLFILLPAGFETTRHFFANMALVFAERPDELSALQSTPGTIPAFVEELLRHAPPIHGLFRMTTEDVVIAGQTIPAHSMVWLLIGAANHDDARFVEASRFDLARKSQGGLAFGHGAHFCLGAPLARLEARIGIEELIARYQRFERSADEIIWNLVPTVRGPNQLWMRVTEAEPAAAP